MIKCFLNLSEILINFGVREYERCGMVWHSLISLDLRELDSYLLTFYINLQKEIIWEIIIGK